MALPSYPSPPPPPPSHRKSRRIILQQPSLDRVEDVSTYQPGGHHPVDLGDVIVGRYRIIHKLGNGGFAIVWLARDLHDSRNVALKILRADASDHEIQVLERLTTIPREAPITVLHNTFTVRGPNGFHKCLVLDPGGPSCRLLTLYFERPPLRFLNSAARSLAEGVAALHMVGVCHGDLTHSNVLFKIPGLDEWSEDTLYRNLGAPVTAPLYQLDGAPAPAFAPARIVSALNYSSLAMEHISAEVSIIDFGEAFFQDNVPEGLGTPASFSAPEMLFGYRPSFAVDLWALGCLIFEILTFRQLIPTFFGSTVEALAMAIETIGALPEHWRKLYCNEQAAGKDSQGDNDRWFDNSISRDRELSSQLRSHLPPLSGHQQATLTQLLRGLMVFGPSHRLAASEAATHPWFQSSCGRVESGKDSQDSRVAVEDGTNSRTTPWAVENSD